MELSHHGLQVTEFWNRSHMCQDASKACYNHLLSSAALAMSTLTTQYCTHEEQLLSAKPNAPLHCFTRNESIALAFWVQSGALSFVACVTTFALIIRNVRYHAKKMPGRWRLVKSPMDVYFLSLFAAEIVLSSGVLINAKWVSNGKLEVGGWCTAQSISLSIGGITVAYSTLAIPLHTFIMVWYSKGYNAVRIAWIAISIPWIFSLIYFIALGTSHPSGPNQIFRPAPYWCWIGKSYFVERVFAVYFWMWASFLISMVLYVPLSFWVRGNITIGDRFWRFQIHRRQQLEDRRNLRRLALSLLAYPIIYAILILPLSVARWIGFVQENHGDKKNHVPPTALLSVQIIYCLSGLSNVVLFFLTRPSLLLFEKEESVDNDQSTRMVFLPGRTGYTGDVIEVGSSTIAGDGVKSDEEEQKRLSREGRYAL